MTISERPGTEPEKQVIRAGGNGLFVMLKALACLFLGLAVAIVWKNGLSDMPLAVMMVALPVAVHALLSAYRIELRGDATVILRPPLWRKTVIPVGSIQSTAFADRSFTVVVEYTRGGRRRRARIPLGIFSLENLRLLVRILNVPEDEDEE